MWSSRHRDGRRRQRGIAVLSAILATIGLLVALGGQMLYSGRRGAEQAQFHAKTQDLIAQAQLIRSQIARCVVDYPGGDNGAPSHKAYPYGRGAEYESDLDVSALKCPGTGTGPEADAADVAVFAGTDGVFMPAAIRDFGQWKYTNDVGSVRIYLDASDARWRSAVAQAAARFTEATRPPSPENRFELIVTR